ncbi:MAG: hypothetical protein ACI4ON_04085 [Clostridia bacterium]
MIEEKEKKYIYLAFIVIIILLIIVLIAIWSPMFSNKSKFADKLSTSTFYKEEDYISKYKEKYKSLALKYINMNNYEELKDKLNPDYLAENDLTVDTAYEYLVKNNILTHTNSTTILYNSDVKNNDKQYIYTYVYKVGDIEKMIHVIEDYYNSYTISFSQDSYPILNNCNFEIDKDGLKFNIQAISSYSESIVINFSVENQTTEEYVFNFNSINDAAAKINNTNVKYLTSVIIGNESSSISSIPGSRVNFNLSFEISSSEQGKISGFIFNNVEKSGEKLSDFVLGME